MTIRDLYLCCSTISDEESEVTVMVHKEHVSTSYTVKDLMCEPEHEEIYKKRNLDIFEVHGPYLMEVWFW